MKKVAALLVVIGSGLAAYGLSCWQLTTQSKLLLPGQSGPDWEISAGWTPQNQLEITVGVTLLAFGVILRKDSK